MANKKYESQSHSHGSAQSSEYGTQKLHTIGAITKEQREHMIAEAAYYMAEHRHFQGGDPMRDWLQAQKEIDSKLKVASR